MSNLKEDMAAEGTEGGQTDFHWTDIVNFEKVFQLAGIERGHTDADFMFFWAQVGIYYLILLLPTYVVVRALLFLILPKSWLKWMFKV